LLRSYFPRELSSHRNKIKHVEEHGSIYDNTYEDMALASWFGENEVILNLKKGKTEAMMFGSGKKLSNAPWVLNVNYEDHTNTLVVELDQTLLLNNHFENC